MTLLNFSPTDNEWTGETTTARFIFTNHNVFYGAHTFPDGSEENKGGGCHHRYVQIDLLIVMMTAVVLSCLIAIDVMANVTLSVTDFDISETNNDHDMLLDPNNKNIKNILHGTRVCNKGFVCLFWSLTLCSSSHCFLTNNNDVGHTTTAITGVNIDEWIKDYNMFV